MRCDITGAARGTLLPEDTQVDVHNTYYSIIPYVQSPGDYSPPADRCVKIWVEDIEDGPTLSLKPGPGWYPIHERFKGTVQRDLYKVYM